MIELVLVAMPSLAYMEELCGVKMTEVSNALKTQLYFIM